MPSSSVSFPSLGQREVRRPSLLEVTQEEYKHDIAVYTMPYGGQSRLYRTGLPVQIEWGNSTDSASFYGYIHHVEHRPSEVSVWCQGATRVFDQGLQATYYRRSVPSVIAELSRVSNFDIDAVSHGRTFYTINFPGGRMWAEMVRLAKEIGYSLYAKNTRLELHPRTTMIDRYLSQAPVFSYAKAGGWGSLYDFAPQEGAMAPGAEHVNRVLNGVNPWTGTRYTVRGGPSTAKLGRQQYAATATRYSDIGTVDPNEARWMVQAMQEMSRYPMRGKATVTGNPRVHQTWPVIFTGVNPTHEGAWFVHKVTHRVATDDYLMDLELGRDGFGSTVSVTGDRPQRVIATRNSPQGRPKSAYPPSTLAAGQWRAAWSAASRTFGGS